MGLRVNCGAKAGVGYYRELTHVAMTQRYHCRVRNTSVPQVGPLRPHFGLPLAEEQAFPAAGNLTSSPHD